MDTLALLRVWNKAYTAQHNTLEMDLRVHEVTHGVNQAWDNNASIMDGSRKVLETRGAKFLSSGGFDLNGSSAEIKKLIRENKP